MARLVSNLVRKGMTRNSMILVVPSRSASLQGAKYSSSVGGDSGTDEGIAPIRQNSDISKLDDVKQEVKENPVMIYMKGLPKAPRCGFSALAVKVVQFYGVPLAARDILGDLELKEAVKAYTNWPTFPQVFIKGEFVGGSDIVLGMHQKGELKDLLANITHDGNQAGKA